MCLPASAQYIVKLDGDLQSEPNSSNQMRHGFFPHISATKNNASTTSKLTFTSPTGAFKGFFNQTLSGSSASMSDTSSMITAINGTWKMSIQEGSSVFNYEVDVGYVPPFPLLPTIDSTTLVNGGTYTGSIQFKLNGGSSAYFGSNGYILGDFSNAAGGTLFEEKYLAVNATSWVPNYKPSGISKVHFFLQTRSDPLDLNSFRVTDIRPLTLNAPSLAFGTKQMTYEAFRSVDLFVPEPAALGGIFALLVLAGRYRRSRN